MKRVVRLGLTALLGIFAATAGHAQQNHDTQWRTKPVERRAYAAKDAEHTLRNFARCVVNRRFEHANAFVLAAEESKAKADALKQLVRRNSIDGCLHGFDNEIRLSFSSKVLNGALGQALATKFYPDLAHMLKKVPVDPATEAARIAPLAPAEVFARCVVRSDPEASLALIASDLYQAAEQAAVSALKPDLGPCLLAGSTITITPVFLRNQIGVAAYRLGTEARPPVAGTGS